METTRLLDPPRLLESLRSDFARLREVAARDLDAAVPTCPGWRVGDLVGHVAEVYLHKVEAMRHNRWPDPWPPDLDGEPRLALLDRAWAELTTEFATRQPDEPAWTFYQPDQSVRFWLRRMAQETVIHRIDAELSLGAEVVAIPVDLAVDGIDELLKIFLEYASRRWHDDFGETLDGWDGRRVAIEVEPAVDADGLSWTVAVESSGVVVAEGLPADGAVAALRIAGRADVLLCWLWHRAGDESVAIDGDRDLLRRFHTLITAGTR